MRSSKHLGVWGEQRAAEYLQRNGFAILARNWRCDSGEADLVIAARGQTAIVEVKTRRGAGYGHPFEAIDARKAQRLRRIAQEWSRCCAGRPVRVDAVSVLLQDGVWLLDHRCGVA